MKEAIYRIGTTLKVLFREKSNLIILLLLLNLILVTYVYLELSDGQYHFYMNTKTSLEHIYNKGVGTGDINYIRFDKYNGDFEKILTTEEKLIRKNNRKFHLKYIFK